MKYKSNVNFACSTEAGIYLFGKKRKFEFIPNAIDLEKFEYNEQTRKEIRKELDLEGKLVIGNVGRFNLQKNHSFLLDIFNEIVKKNKDSILLLIGTGELEENIKQKIKELKLEKRVKLLGVRKDVNKLYQAMDIFLMPSLFEGLPLTGVEAQASKLKCYFADTITKEVIISNNVKFLSLKLTPEQWADKIVQDAKYERNNVEILNQDFNIKILAKNMEEKYQKYNRKSFKE